MVIICNQLQAQHYEDSLLNIINIAKHDSTKVDAINAFSFGYYTPDSSFYYAKKIIAAGNALHNQLVIAMALAKLATSYMRIQEDTKVLQTGLAALKLAEPYNNPVVLATIYDILSYGYRLNFPKAAEYELKAVNIIDHNKPNRFYVIILNNYSTLLTENGHADSALKYTQRAYEMSLPFGKYEARTFINLSYARIHLSLGNNELAKTYLNLVLEEAKQNPYNKLYYFAYLGFADYYNKINQKDSAAYYYSLSLKYAKNSTGIGQYIIPSRWLYEYYKGQNRGGSAFKYMDVYLKATDSLQNLKQAIQVQNISFEEELRQNSLKQEKGTATEARKHNIQLAILAIGILSAIILFLLLSRSIIVSHKLVEFLSVIVLLVVFEFINLVLHPYLQSLTHDSPLLMLLALVAIAALIVPLHHRLEKWTKNKLVEKNKKIRLEAAKKTIQQLEG